MFPWSRPKCPVEPDVKAWVERRMSWLVGQFGRDRLLQGEVILPDEQHFPDPYDGSEAAARVLLDRVCRYMDMDPRGVALRLYSERRRMAPSVDVILPDGGTAGLYTQQGGRTTVWLEESRLADPTSVVATFAHELCHAHLLGGGRVADDEADHEPLTDLATIFFGMGVFTANASLRDKSYHAGNWEGWSISRQGYLTAPTLAYGLALYAWLRRETGPDWARYLRLDVRSPFQKAEAYLAHTKNAVVLPRESQEAGPPACPPSLQRQLGVGLPDGGQPEGDDVADAADAAGGDDAPADDRFTQATVLVLQGQWEEAVRLLSAVLLDDPQDGEAYQQRALAYMGLGRGKEALADAELAVRWSPDDSESYRVRGTAYLGLQQCARAIADFTRYLDEEDVTAANPERLGRICYARGAAYAKDGDLGQAIADFSRAIRRWPQWPAPYEARASLYEQQGEAKRALADRAEAARRAKSLASYEPAPEHWSAIIAPPGIC